MLARCREAYENYEFHAVYHTPQQLLQRRPERALSRYRQRTGFTARAANSTKRRAPPRLRFTKSSMSWCISWRRSFLCTAEEVWGQMPDKDRRPGSVPFFRRFLSRTRTTIWMAPLTRSGSGSFVNGAKCLRPWRRHETKALLTFSRCQGSILQLREQSVSVFDLMNADKEKLQGCLVDRFAN